MFSRIASRASVAKTVIRRSQSTLTAGATAARVATPAAIGVATAVGAAFAWSQTEAFAEKVEPVQPIAPPPSPFSDAPKILDYTGKRVVVTGGASGIGLEMVRLFTQQGAEVFILDFNVEAATARAAEFVSNGFKVTGLKCDVSNQESVEAAFAQITAGGRVDVLCNNAGIGHVGNIMGTEVADMERVMGVNVTGVMLCAKEAIRSMNADKKGGVILNTASIASIRPIKDRIAYAASKGAVHTLTMALATDHLADGIRVNEVCPGRIHTTFVDNFIKKNYPGEEEAKFKMLSEYMPNGRMGKPGEIAFAALYLCSDEARFVTGASFSIDGGVAGTDHPKLYDQESIIHPETVSTL